MKKIILKFSKKIFKNIFFIFLVFLLFSCSGELKKEQKINAKELEKKEQISKKNLEKKGKNLQEKIEKEKILGKNCFDFPDDKWEKLKEKFKIKNNYNEEVGEKFPLCAYNDFLEIKQNKYVFDHIYEGFSIDKISENIYSFREKVNSGFDDVISFENKSINFCFIKNKLEFGKKCVDLMVNKKFGSIEKIGLYNKNDTIIFVGILDDFADWEKQNNNIKKGYYKIVLGNYYFIIKGKEKKDNFGFKERKIELEGTGEGAIVKERYSLLTKKEKEFFENGGKISLDFFKGLFGKNYEIKEKDGSVLEKYYSWNYNVGDYVSSENKCKNNVGEILENFDKYKINLEFVKDLNSDNYLFEIYIDGKKFIPKCIK